MLLVWAAAAAVIGLLGMIVWRMQDHRADWAEMNRLIALQPREPEAFSLQMIAALPEPAQRYFKFTIADGARLYTVAQIEMSGRFSLGSKEKPNYMDMTATQVLAAPDGFVWKMSCGSGLLRLSGSDSGRWTRFWLAGVVPVGRFGGDPDHTRSAFGRYVAEALIWAPATLLPGASIQWEPLGQDSARVIIRHGELDQAVDVTVNSAGQPVAISFQRWSDANPEKVHRYQPFGAYVSDFRNVDGYRLPFHVEAGNMFGTDKYFAFFIANITHLEFPAVATAQ